MKKICLLLFCCQIAYLLRAQDSIPAQKQTATKVKTIDQKGIYVGLQPGISLWQDQRFTQAIYRGLGTGLELGYFNLTDKRILEVAGQAAIYFQDAISNLLVSQIYGQGGIDLFYLFRLKDISSWTFYLGPELATEIRVTNNNDLGNNSFHYIYNHSLAANGFIQKRLTEQTAISWQLSLGLLGMVKNSTSFSFSIPQNILEDGEFTYDEDANLSAPYRSPEFVLLGKLNRINSTIQYQWRKLRFAYSWEIFNLIEIEKRAINAVQHGLSLSIIF